ncbi:MAG: hypothetical protein HQL32_11490 [Planctomycetes bacterium]|nr:hypothetical protein [Planctomycetota bacterium]
MQELPKKLKKYLQKLDHDKANEAKELFFTYLNLAEENQFQSPRFWAMRQVLSERSEQQVMSKANKRIRKNHSSKSDPGPDS